MIKKIEIPKKIEVNKNVMNITAEEFHFNVLANKINEQNDTLSQIVGVIDTELCKECANNSGITYKRDEQLEEWNRSKPNLDSEVCKKHGHRHFGACNEKLPSVQDKDYCKICDYQNVEGKDGNCKHWNPRIILPHTPPKGDTQSEWNKENTRGTPYPSISFDEMNPQNSEWNKALDEAVGILDLNEFALTIDGKTLRELKESFLSLKKPTE